jgi:hypothetical protein
VARPPSRRRALPARAAFTLPTIVIGGVGFGPSFSGALRSVAPLAEARQRAGLFAAVYLVAYLSFGIPAILAGLLITPVGLTTTVVGYDVAIVITAAVGLLAQLRAGLIVATERQ